MKFLAIAYAFTVIFLSVISPADSTTDIGFVLEMHGNWLANGKKIEQLGEGIQAGASISLAAETTFASGEVWKITIVLLNDEPLPVSCNSFDDCKKKQPFSIPTSLNKPSSAAGRFFDAMKHLFGLEPERYVSTISRGAGEPSRKLQDEVLLFDQSRLELGHWFDAIPPGDYMLTLVYIGRDGRSAAPLIIPFHWNGNNRSIDSKDLEPGLYTLRIFEGSGGEQERFSQDAWILICNTSDYEKNAAAFHQKRTVTQSWTSVDPEAKQTFLRIALDQLAYPLTSNHLGN